MKSVEKNLTRSQWKASLMTLANSASKPIRKCERPVPPNLTTDPFEKVKKWLCAPESPAPGLSESDTELLPQIFVGSNSQEVTPPAPAQPQTQEPSQVLNLNKGCESFMLSKAASNSNKEKRLGLQNIHIKRKLEFHDSDLVVCDSSHPNSASPERNYVPKRELGPTTSNLMVVNNYDPLTNNQTVADPVDFDSSHSASTLQERNYTPFHKLSPVTSNLIDINNNDPLTNSQTANSVASDNSHLTSTPKKLDYTTIYELCPITGNLIEVNNSFSTNSQTVADPVDSDCSHPTSTSQERNYTPIYELCPITGNLIEVLNNSSLTNNQIVADPVDSDCSHPTSTSQERNYTPIYELDPIISNAMEVNALSTHAGKTPESMVTESDISKQSKSFFGRKRTKDKEKWKVQQAHTARHAGLAYTSKEGKHFPAKEMGPGCDEKSCFLKCQSKIAVSDRAKAKESFYQMPNQVRKWEFIRSHVKSATPQKVKDKNNPKRKISNQYYLSVKGKKIRVCQTMFLHTLVISDFVVRTALSKQNAGGAIGNDGRGGKKAERLTPEEVTNSIAEHIALFPRVPSHYCRANTNYEYLEAEVENVSNMHILYLIWMKDQDKCKTATERQYRDYFNNLPIKIHKPKKDLCDICLAFDTKKNKSEEERRVYEDHILRKDLVNALYNRDRTETALTSKEVSVCAFDLQKILLLPKSMAGYLYYKRKISNFNFTIYDMGCHEGYCFVYHEGIGKKGANEIASFVYMYIQKKAALGIKNFNFYSDNCTSQNKNRFLFCMYVLAAEKLCVRIEHRYLISGHTHNAADNMHALIERKTRKRDVFTTEQWCSLMEEAKVTGKKYDVKRVAQLDIKNFHPIANHLNFQGIRLSEISEIVCDPKSPFTLGIKCDLSDLPISFNVKGRKAGRPMCLKSYELSQAYSGPLPITKEKKKDLEDIIRENIIPEENISYYQEFSAKEQEGEDDFE